MRFAGITLPGNAVPAGLAAVRVSGSMIDWSRPLALAVELPVVWIVCEKSPPRSRTVGRFVRLTVVGRTSRVNSCEMKKYVFFVFVRLRSEERRVGKECRS